MRAILGSYDSELAPAEHSPQLTRRMREAEDMVQKVHAHSSEMEVSVWRGGCHPGLSRACLSVSAQALQGGTPASPESVNEGQTPSHPGDPAQQLLLSACYAPFHPSMARVAVLAPPGPCVLVIW